jgi:(R)-2-hydroxyacyl-CoA dehydratese activating ATPase
MITLGIDIGSRNTKIVIFDHQQRQVIFSAWQVTEISVTLAVEKLLAKAAKVLDIDDIAASCVTGYGRKMYGHADRIRSEIICHASACRYLFPEVRTVIDIGGQDSKIISLQDDGSVKDFVMNDKCAAGTGRFLEMTAMKLQCDLNELSQLASKADTEIPLNSTCVVFAESEIIGLLATGNQVSNIARAVNMSIARRIFAQMAPLQGELPIVFTGGVAQGRDLAVCLGKLLDTELLIPPDPEITGALGAAILAI